MSEHLTHVAVAEDAARIALLSDNINEAFKIAINNHMDAVRLGSVGRSGDAYTMEFLHFARDNWNSREDGDFVEEKLAFLIGWRGHLAADRRWKGEYRVVDNEHYANNKPSPSTASIYHDIVVFNEVYDRGKSFPYSKALLDYRLESHPAFKALDVLAVEEVFVPAWRRQLLELQSFLSEDADDDFDRFIALTVGGSGRPRTERFDISMLRYADAAQQPHKDFMRRFIAEPNFYDRSNAIIRLARSQQQGYTDTSINLQYAVEMAKDQSQYAQALSLAFTYYQAASDYFEGKINEERFRLLSNMGEHHAPRSQR